MLKKEFIMKEFLFGKIFTLNNKKYKLLVKKKAECKEVRKKEKKKFFTKKFFLSQPKP